jgi:hypothetical protein
MWFLYSIFKCIVSFFLKRYINKNCLFLQVATKQGTILKDFCQKEKKVLEGFKTPEMPNPRILYQEGVPNAYVPELEVGGTTLYDIYLVGNTSDPIDIPVLERLLAWTIIREKNHFDCESYCAEKQYFLEQTEQNGGFEYEISWVFDKILTRAFAICFFDISKMKAPPFISKDRQQTELTLVELVQKPPFNVNEHAALLLRKRPGEIVVDEIVDQMVSEYRDPVSVYFDLFWKK